MSEAPRPRARPRGRRVDCSRDLGIALFRFLGMPSPILCRESYTPSSNLSVARSVLE